MADSERELVAKLKYVTDGDSLQVAEKKLRDMLREQEKRSRAMEENGKRIKQEGKILEEQEGRRLKLVNQTVDAYKKEQQEIKQIGETMKKVSSGLMQFSTVLFSGGTATAGGIFALGARYIKNAEESTETTKRWLAAQKEIEKSQEKIGEVAAQTVLPVYEKVSEVVGKVANFVETNPEAMKLLFGAGIAVSLVGLLGVAVAKGIRVVADVTTILASANQLLAAKIMKGAADEQLAAASLAKTNILQKLGMVLGGEAGVTAAVGSVASIATTVAAVLAVLVGGVAVGTLVNDIITKVTGKGAYTNQFLTVGANAVGKNVLSPVAQLFGMSPEEAERKVLVFTAIVGKLTGAIDESSPLWIKAGQSIEKTNKNVEDLTKGLLGLADEETQKQVVAAYEDMMKEEKRITKDYGEEIAKILDEATNAETELRARNSKAVDKIYSQASSQISKALRDSQREDEKQYQQYVSERAKIASEGGEEILQIEQETQEKLRKLREEHEDRIADIIDQRDALAFVKEKRAFARSQNGIEKEGNKAIQAQRAEIAQRLEDLKSSYITERNERQQNLQNQLAEIRAQRAQQLAEQHASFVEELKQIQDQKKEKLSELEKQSKEELVKNRQGFIDKVRQLDASLLGEKDLRQRYYNSMLLDAEKWLAAYRGKLNGLSTASVDKNATSTTPAGFAGQTTPQKIKEMLRRIGINLPGFSQGGYATGLVNTGENGTEFILSHQTTKLAEAILGTRLSQQSLLTSLLKLKSKSVQINDYRRFDRMPSQRENRNLNKEMFSVLKGALG